MSNSNHESTPLLSARANGHRRVNKLAHQDDDEASSFVRSHLTADELKMGDSAVGERLPYNDYTTIDWLHDLVCAGLLLLRTSQKHA